VARHGSLQKLLRATAAELEEIDGVSPVIARTVKDGLARLAESSILDSYN
jgi:DNA integrity scanning protein DisA with diadenylate cyclase activity